MQTKGASGPSNFDSESWRHILNSKNYGCEGTDRCKAIAKLTRQLCTDQLTDPESISSLMACSLIPLDKDPGLRPIGIGEVLRRIIGKAVTHVLRSELQSSAGGLQLCVGQPGGSEVAIHAMEEIFADDNTHGLIQVDANNAFNTINRKVLMHNIHVLCPEIATFTINCYMKPARHFVIGGVELSSCKGSTQGDPIAMPIYAIGILPLMSTVVADSLPETLTQVKQVTFVGDLTGAGTIDSLKFWWDKIITYGPYLGYNAKPSKSWLIVKTNMLIMLKKYFQTLV